MLKAVEILKASPSRNWDNVRQMIEYLFMGLRPGFTFGVSPSSSGSSILKLLEFADQLDRSSMTKRDVDEVGPSYPWSAGFSTQCPQIAMFQAIQSSDRMSLCSLAKTFTESGNHPAALLCLDHALSPPLSLQDIPLTRIQALFSMYPGYIQLLRQLPDDESFAEGSNHQRLFGFQTLQQSRYLAPKHTLLYKRLVGQSSGQSSSSQQGGVICDYGVLRRCIVKLIESRIRDRTTSQNAACCEVHGFSPCFQLLVQKECNPSDKRAPCTFQHIQPEQLTVDWYRARLRLILLQFRILDSARLYDLDLAKYVLAHSLGRACPLYLLNVKLLAWDVVLDTPPAFSGAWIAYKSCCRGYTPVKFRSQDCTKVDSACL